jgi:hypothetical protein
MLSYLKRIVLQPNYGSDILRTMKTLYAFDIDYDTDNDGEPIPSLPQKLMFKVDNNFDAENDLAELISQETGVLVNGCSFSWTK